ncbi:uncharacterized protein LOC122078510 [Macadamia integrifolia]|uniref:uncharacterized protein LOC122078510 n=1 Tax=Macadamia integrifolia TaxID=60698 RepID=UPI001C4FCD46|nr:uncharacterized protein LOC122078510 [Macadamia integrifolia]
MMQAMHQSPLLSQSPSFNSYSSSRLAEIAAKVTEEFPQDKDSSLPTRHLIDEGPPKPLKISNDQPSQEDVDDDDFEFAFVARDPDGSPISADEIFDNGQIRPIYPVFNQDLLFADDSKLPKKSSTLRLPLGKLMTEDRDFDNDNFNPPSSSSSEADELDSLPAGSYCVWKPKSVEASPDRCKKSSSTGSGSSKRWKFRDFLPRSNSDGKDTYVFLSQSKTMRKRNYKTEKAADRAAVPKADQHQQHPKERRNSISNPEHNSSQDKVAVAVAATAATAAAKGKVKAKGVSVDTVSAHEIHYVRNRAIKEEDRKRSFLPYRQDLVGFFSNVNGLSRNLHPF